MTERYYPQYYMAACTLPILALNFSQYWTDFENCCSQSSPKIGSRWRKYQVSLLTSTLVEGNGLENKGVRRGRDETPEREMLLTPPLSDCTGKPEYHRGKLHNIDAELNPISVIQPSMTIIMSNSGNGFASSLFSYSP